MTSKLKTDVLETVSGSGTIALTNQLSGMTSASMPSGSVLQVLEGTTATEVLTSSSSYVTTGLTLTITPSSASSKMLVSFSTPADAVSDTTDTGGDFTIYRGSTDLLTRGGDTYYNSINAVNLAGYAAMSKLDSPNTASAVTYTVYFRARNSNTTMKSQHNTSSGTITAMEIKG
jgi:hypothetical protein